MEDRGKVVSKLNTLLEKNYDAEKSYREAAERSENPLIKNILKSEAETRHNFGIKIKDEIAKLGGMPEKSDGTTGKIHKAWIDIRSALAVNSDKAVIEECRRGDKAAIEEYESVLKENELTESSRKVIQQQREEITDIYHQWKNLKI